MNPILFIFSLWWLFAVLVSCIYIVLPPQGAISKGPENNSVIPAICTGCVNPWIATEQGHGNGVVQWARGFRRFYIAWVPASVVPCKLSLFGPRARYKPSGQSGVVMPSSLLSSSWTAPDPPPLPRNGWPRGLDAGTGPLMWSVFATIGWVWICSNGSMLCAIHQDNRFVASTWYCKYFCNCAVFIESIACVSWNKKRWSLRAAANVTNFVSSMDASCSKLCVDEN